MPSLGRRRSAPVALTADAALSPPLPVWSPTRAAESVATVQEVVSRVRAAHGLGPVPVVTVDGGAGGAWNWRERRVELSPDVAGYTELQQVGLAAHEASHSVYVDTHRTWMVPRTAPIVVGVVVAASLIAAAAFTSMVTFGVATFSAYLAAWATLQVISWVLRGEERAADRDAARALGPEPLLAFLTHLQTTRPMSRRRWWGLRLCGVATHPPTPARIAAAQAGS